MGLLLQVPDLPLLRLPLFLALHLSLLLLYLLLLHLDLVPPLLLLPLIVLDDLGDLLLLVPGPLLPQSVFLGPLSLELLHLLAMLFVLLFELLSLQFDQLLLVEPRLHDFAFLFSSLLLGLPYALLVHLGHHALALSFPLVKEHLLSLYFFGLFFLDLLGAFDPLLLLLLLLLVFLSRKSFLSLGLFLLAQVELSLPVLLLLEALSLLSLLLLLP